MRFSLLIRFIVVKLIHLDLNFRFNISVVFITNYFLVGDIILINSETLLMIDFVHLKIKSVQSFIVTHRNRYVYIYL
jgi:hypothetical protein